MKERGIVLLSGGLDSAILCAYLQMAEQDDVLPLFIDRHQRAVENERAAATAVVQNLKLPNKLIEVAVGLDAYRGLISEKDRERIGIPGRNVVLIALAAPYAYLAKANYIAIGANASDSFPDTKPNVFSPFSETLTNALGTEITVRAPFAESNMTKDAVIKYGFDQNLQKVIWQTLSCFFPRDGLHCGNCPGCSVRKAAFEAAGLKDETRYAA